MLIIGENINATRKQIAEKIELRDTEFFQSLARKQVESGANMLDINIGDKNPEDRATMQWLVKTVQDAVQVPLCFDSPYFQIIQAGLEAYQFSCGQPLVNSVTAEKDRLKSILPLVKKYHCSVIALLMDENGIPDNAQDRFSIARKIIQSINDFGILSEDIYLDPLVIPVSTDSSSAITTLKTLTLIRENDPDIKTVSGMSNISYGLPERRIINQAFLPLLLETDIDALILDPTDQKLMALFYGSQALLGKDLFCKEYLQAYRNGRL